MSNPTTPKTKRERIRELILAASPTKFIVDQVHTSKEYVYKERGKLKEEGLLVEHRSLTVSDGQKDIVVVKDRPKIERYVDIGESITVDPVKSPIQDFDIPPLDKNGVMLMYDAFEKGMGPSEVTAKFGIRPVISHNEHQRFLSMKLRDPFYLQNRIVSGVSGAPPEIQSIIDKSIAGTLLTNDELVSVIDFKTTNYASQHIKNAVSNPSISIAYGLERFVCKYCHFLQPGVIFDRTTYGGQILQGLSKGHCCKNCFGIKEQAFEEYQRDSGKL